jgi:glycosyltransferase involved in cell wall biosynthesis
MRIAVVDGVVEDGSDRSGRVRALRRQPLYRLLAERGHDVTVVTASRQRVQGVRTERVPAVDGHPDRLDPLVSRLSELWGRRPPEVVHAFEPVAEIAAYAAASKLPVPVVQAGDHVAAPLLTSEVRRPDPRVDRLWRAVVRRSSGVTAPSSQTEAELIRVGVPRELIHVVPPGVDVAQFAPVDDDAALGSVRRLVYAGSLDAAGGADVIVRALRHVPEVSLVIAHLAQAQAATTDVDRLRRAARALGVADRVRFQETRTEAALATLLRTADIFVCTPFHEPPEITALQAMACGVPVVVSDVGILRDAMIVHATGELVPPGRPDLLATAVRHMINDVTHRRGCALAGVDRIRARYTWARIAHDVETVYENALAA